MNPAVLMQADPLGIAGNPIVSFLPMVLIFGIFYFLLIRPMQKQRKDQQNLIAKLESGKVVVTTGGIIGTIVAVADNTIVLRVKPDNVKLQVSRTAVSGLFNEESK